MSQEPSLRQSGRFVRRALTAYMGRHLMHYETPRDKWSVCDFRTLWQPNCETENRGRAEQESGKVAGLVTSENGEYRN
jgi:hypothetical protein